MEARLHANLACVLIEDHDGWGGLEVSLRARVTAVAFPIAWEKCVRITQGERVCIPRSLDWIDG